MNTRRFFSFAGRLVLLILLCLHLNSEQARAQVEEGSEQPTIHMLSQPAFTIFGEVEVTEDESAPDIVSVIGDYVMRGHVRGNAVSVLGTGSIQGEVERDSVTVLGDIDVRGPVGGDLVVVGGRAYIDAPVEGKIVLVLSDVEFGPKASNQREMVIVGPKPTVDPAAELIGARPVVWLPSISFLSEYLREGPLYGRLIPPGVGWVWYVVLFLFIFRLLVLLAVPRPIAAGVEVMREGVLRTFLIGVIAYILYLPTLALLGVTVVGSVAVPFVALAWEIAVLLGKIAVLAAIGSYLGRRLGIERLNSPVAGFVLGTIVVTLIYMVPVMAVFVHVLIKPVSIGCMLVAAVDAFQRERRPPVMSVGDGQPLRAAGDPEGSAGGGGFESEPPPIRGRVGFWPRAAASILDLVFVVVLMHFILRSSEWIPAVWIGYHLGMWTWRGATLGGAVLSIRMVRIDGRPMDFLTSLIRLCGALFSLLVAGLGFFWASWNRDCQSWHDIIAGTVMIRTPRPGPIT